MDRVSLVQLTTTASHRTDPYPSKESLECEQVHSWVLERVGGRWGGRGCGGCSREGACRRWGGVRGRGEGGDGGEEGGFILYLQSSCSSHSDRDAFVSELMRFVKVSLPH